MEAVAFHKVANIIGHTMQFHPHCDASNGSALVGMAKTAVDRKQLGDPSRRRGSAPRYIEARLASSPRR
jgi:topoisomerase-4 subunit A